ncbi:CnrY/NccY family anti-sigma factor [Ralstonia pseudosolanacearum]|uniref:CnrY/NccY family anti-sigma factor n=1 Tax=Ralstonia pseudosolanacearum TaxID=1310165 RepID=UPI00035EF63E|nr:CnrY/NccY family anti-sigma factor [Ralstonia pseudosolanacearum]MCK4125512.1 CnrY/NccY family anti-sigma factor [Ralstonia pseudosolanacearum]
MANLEEWLSDAAKITRKTSSAASVARIQQRLATEPAPDVLVARYDAQRAMLCAAVAALVAFTAIDHAAMVIRNKPAPTWVAAPSAASPFGLLIGE